MNLQLLISLFEEKKGNFLSKLNFEKVNQVEILNCEVNKLEDLQDKKLYPDTINGKRILYISYNMPGRDYGRYFFSDLTINELYNKILSYMSETNTEEYFEMLLSHGITLKNKELISLINEYDFICDVSWGWWL